MTAYLVGGGRGVDIASLLHSFVTGAASQRPRIATVLIDEGSGEADIGRFTDLLAAAGDCSPIPVLVPIGDGFDVAVLDDVDGLFVCGGLTPTYAAALAPGASTIRTWLNAGHSYGGFSAGSAIAADRAIVGGWQLDGVPICAEESSEDLDELSVVDGLGILPFAIDVHCAPWGTLSRLVAAVEAGAVTAGAGIDESTMLAVGVNRTGRAEVRGAGRVWLVTRSIDGVAIRVLHDGDGFDLSEVDA